MMPGSTISNTVKKAGSSLKIFGMILFVLLAPLNAHAIDTFTAHGGPIKDIALSPDQKWVVTSSFDYSAVLWHTPTMQPKLTLIGHDAAVNTAAFSPDGRWLTTGSDDHMILLWEIAELLADPDGYQPIPLAGHKGKIVGLAFSRDSSILASASWDGSIGIWKPAETTVPLRFIDGHDGPVNAVQFSTDTSHLYSAGYDGHIRYWRLADAMYLRSIVRNGWGVNVMTVDETAGILAYGSTDGAMRVIRLDSRETLMAHGDERVPVLSLHHNQRTGQMAFGNAKGRVIITDTSKWALQRDFRAANGPVWGLALLPDDGSMLVAGLDDYISKWHIYDYPPEYLDETQTARRFQPTSTISNGERQFARKCSVCHTLQADGKRRAGPTLHGVFGRRAGTLPGYPYSEALRNANIVWNADTISKLFNDGPDKVTPGTKMPIQRMKNPQDREDLIKFLESATRN